MRSRPKHRTRKMPSDVDAKGTSAHLILNPAAGNTAALLGNMARSARERGMRVLVVVPTGTLNHFARDLGLDLAHPLRVLDVFYAGHDRRVDVGRINGRPFINNVSLGVYAEMLGDPAYRQDKLGVAPAKLQAAFSDPQLRRALRITPPDEA